MGKKYLIRLDDACPTMDIAKWTRVEDLLDHYGIKPLVGVIPHNEDVQQIIDPVNVLFWDKVKQWQNKGWLIALHGYSHKFESSDGLKGLNPMWKRSEFSGLPLKLQCDKIREGIAIMSNHGVSPRYFFAPAHTFDENTLEALRKESDIRMISDTVALYPYKYHGFVFIPQFGGMCREMKLKGLYTFCLHPSKMNEDAFIRTEEFLKKHKYDFTTFDSLNQELIHPKSWFDNFLQFSYFMLRSLRRIE